MSARSLEGKKFFTNYNNGVYALISEDTLMDVNRYYLISTALHRTMGDDSRAGKALDGVTHLHGPIFTFAQLEERAERDPWFTGSYEDYRYVVSHIERDGGQVKEGSHYVPFSNGYERGLRGPETQIDELRQVTTFGQFRATFGISLDEVLKQ